MPYEPQPLTNAVVAQMRTASFEDYLARTVTFWETLLAGGLDITLAERKVTETFKANLIYGLISRDKVDSFYIQKVNEFQYDQFWLRDAAYFVRMYDLSGYPRSPGSVSISSRAGSVRTATLSARGTV